MSHRILHLSDTHLTAAGYDTNGIDTAASLRRMLADTRYLDGLDLVIVSGDVADDGSAAGYAAAREIVGGFAAARGIPHVYAIGNHDDRAAFAGVLGSGHLSSSGADAGRQCPGGPERAATSDIAGLRIITIDSLIPGQVHGRVSAEQLGWLASVLAEPAPAGSVIVVHHPPVRVPTSVFLTTGGLENTEELAEVVAGTDVQVILSGHYHAQVAAQLSGIPVWVTPGVASRIDLTAPAGLVRAVRGASATVVELGGPFSPSFHVIHARDDRAGEQVYLADASSWEPVSAEDTA
jgi:Icc protein